MSMSWMQTLGATNKSFEAELARRDMANSVLMKIAQERESQRSNRAREGADSDQLAENAAYRHEMIEQRRQAQQTLDADRKSKIDERTENDRQDAERQKLISDAINDPTRSKQERESLRIFQLTGHMPAASVQNPVDPFAIIDAKAKAEEAAKERAAARAAKLASDKAGADKPNLPGGVQNYLFSMLGKTKPNPADPKGKGLPYTFEDAMGELSRAWPNIVKYHTGVQSKDAVSMLKGIYSRPDDAHLAEPGGDDEGGGGGTTVKMYKPDGKGGFLPDAGDVPADRAADALSHGYKMAQ